MSFSWATSSAVHPHGCGELEKHYSHVDYNIGSSPRMWGTPIGESGWGKSGRFIPTDVGNSDGVMVKTPDTPVHPHGCGELVSDSLAICPVHGSSPRMWGTRTGSANNGVIDRFIPTDVGNSQMHCFLALYKPVHPHGCGELASLNLNRRRKNGSSPRMWGTQYVGSTAHLNNRFIPTDVGNSRLNRRPLNAHPVHPHGCGELSHRRPVASRSLGSSPRMWGTHSLGSGGQADDRFIPTDVGNSISPPM